MSRAPLVKTRFEMVSRPWAYDLHLTITEADLREFDKDRLDKIRCAVDLIREALAGQDEDGDR